MPHARSLCRLRQGATGAQRAAGVSGPVAGRGDSFYYAGMGGDAVDARVMVALLGPVEIGPAGGAMAPVAQPRLRVLLGLLGVAAGRVVSAESLVDGVWGEEWSPRREQNLHALVYQLRRRLAVLEPGTGEARLARAGGGYRLALGPGELDVAVFEDRGHRSGAGPVRAGIGVLAGGGAGRCGAAVPTAGRGGGTTRGAQARGGRGADRS
jgi:hypothetical protein